MQIALGPSTPPYLDDGVVQQQALRKTMHRWEVERGPLEAAGRAMRGSRARQPCAAAVSGSTKTVTE